MPDSASAAAPVVVLDTNVALDLWLFGDPRVAPLRAALQAGRLQALATHPMRAELAAVLRRPFAQAVGQTPEAVLAAWTTNLRLVEPPPECAPWPPRCSDPDDQKFIDLAWHGEAAWLFSRDRAVLKLARAARTRGLRIATPEAWAAGLA